MNGISGTGPRAGIVFAIFVIPGVLIGKKYDEPMVGLAVGLSVAALVNGFMDARVFVAAGAQ